MKVIQIDKVERIRRYRYMAGERDDCSVVGLAMVLGIPYIRAWEIMSTAGRKRRKGFDTEGFFKYFTPRGFSMLRLRKGEKIRIKKFAKKHTKGTYWLETEDHILSLIDGVIYDSGSVFKNDKLARVYEIEKLS